MLGTKGSLPLLRLKDSAEAQDWPGLWRLIFMCKQHTSAEAECITHGVMAFENDIKRNNHQAALSWMGSDDASRYVVTCNKAYIRKLECGRSMVLSTEGEFTVTLTQSRSICSKCDYGVPTKQQVLRFCMHKAIVVQLYQLDARFYHTYWPKDTEKMRQIVTYTKNIATVTARKTVHPGHITNTAMQG